jgi:hypothetical protein
MNQKSVRQLQREYGAKMRERTVYMGFGFYSDVA